MCTAAEQEDTEHEQSDNSLLKDVSSSLKLTPTRGDNTANYTCTPRHPTLGPRAMQASVMLDVHCKCHPNTKIVTD